MYKLIAIGFCALALAVSGCSNLQDSDGDDKSMTIGLFGPQANSYFNAHVEAAEEWAKANNAKVTVYDSGFDAQKQFNQLQDVITQGNVDGIVVAPLNGPALATLIKTAKDADIATVSIDSPLSTNLTTTDPTVPGLDGLVWTPAPEVGKNLADAAVLGCDGLTTCEVVYEAVLMTQPAEQAIYAAFEKELEAHSNISLLSVRDKCMAQRAPAVTVTQDLLQAEPEVNVIVSADQCLLGAEVAIKQAGREFGTARDQIRLVGGGGTTQGLQRVLAGDWVATKTGVPRDEMTLALGIVKDVINGDLTTPKGIDPVLESEFPPIMTKQTIEDTGFKGQFSA